MLENFTAEEIETIKKELGVTDRTKASKKSLFREEYNRLHKLTKLNENPKADSDVWLAVCCLCDYALRNYRRSGRPIETIDRYSTVWSNKQKEYGEMVKELVDIFAKHDISKKTVIDKNCGSCIYWRLEPQICGNPDSDSLGLLTEEEYGCFDWRGKHGTN